MRGRVDESRYKIWVLTRTNRWVLAGGVSLVVFLTLLALSIGSPAPMRRVINTTDAMWWVFSPMITAIITVVALVVTFNQLVLSQELGALGDQRTRMQEASSFRKDVESWLNVSVAPSDPAAFMGEILDTIQSIANDIETSVEKDETEHAQTIRTFVDELTENAQSVGTVLENTEFGTFDIIFAALNFNYSWKIYEARRLTAEHGDVLDGDTTDALADLVSVLEYFGPAREHFKTLYFQWELVNLSRAMLYASVPALVTAIGMLLYVDTTGVTGTILGIDNVVWLVCIAVTVTLWPFFLLLSYVLRIATVAKRTLAIGPFVLRETERGDTISWE